MSWSSRIGGLVSGRFSPFGRPSPDAPSNTVTASDFSYITDDDLATSTSATVPTAPGPNTDVLTFKHRRTHHPIHFPAGSIASGALTIGAARDAAARKLGCPADRLRLYFRGRNLTPLPDAMPARDAGLRGDAHCEILCVIGEVAISPPAAATTAAGGTVAAGQDEDDDNDDDDDSAAATDAPSKRKRNRRGKKKSSRKSTGTSTPTGALPDGGVALPPSSSMTSPPASKPAAAAPQTAAARLDAIAAHLHGELAGACAAFAAAPPRERARREFEHKRLGESVLAGVILKLDGVEVDGDEEARGRRRELVREAQGWLGRLDEVARGCE